MIHSSSESTTSSPCVRALVFACGPCSLVESAEETATALGVDFHHETFLL